MCCCWVCWFLMFEDRKMDNMYNMNGLMCFVKVVVVSILFVMLFVVCVVGFDY